MILTLRFIPESKAPIARKVDVPGQLLVIILLASLTYGIIQAPVGGWSSPLIFGAFIVAAAALRAFLFWERRVTEPLVDLRFFKAVPFSSATMVADCRLCRARWIPLSQHAVPSRRSWALAHCRRARHAADGGHGHDPADDLGSNGGPNRFGTPLVISGLGLGISCLMLVGLNATTSFTWLFVAYAIFGIGFGFVNAPITNAAVSGMPRAQAGRRGGDRLNVATDRPDLGRGDGGRLVTAGTHKAGYANFAEASRAGWWVLSVAGTDTGPRPRRHLEVGPRDSPAHRRGD